MSYAGIVNYTNGYEDSGNIDFSKMNIWELFYYIDRCKKNAALKQSSYWLGMADKATREVMRRKIENGGRVYESH